MTEATSRAGALSQFLKIYDRPLSPATDAEFSAALLDFLKWPLLCTTDVHGCATVAAQFGDYARQRACPTIASIGGGLSAMFATLEQHPQWVELDNPTWLVDRKALFSILEACQALIEAGSWSSIGGTPGFRACQELLKAMDSAGAGSAPLGAALAAADMSSTGTTPGLEAKLRDAAAAMERLRRSSLPWRGGSVASATPNMDDLISPQVWREALWQDRGMDVVDANVVITAVT